MIPYKQLSLADIFKDRQIEEDKPQFLALLERRLFSDSFLCINGQNP